MSAATARRTTVIYHERRSLHFTNHAMERWLERQPDRPRGSFDLVPVLQAAVATGRKSGIPPYARLNAWHRARADHCILVDGGAFVVTRDEHKRLVVTTFLQAPREQVSRAAN